MSSDIAAAVFSAEALATQGSLADAQQALVNLAKEAGQPLLYRVQAIEALNRLQQSDVAHHLILELSAEVGSSCRSSSPTWNRLAKTLADMGHKERALSLWETLIVQDPRCKPAIDQLVRLGATELLERLVSNSHVALITRLNIALVLTELQKPQYEKIILIECLSSSHEKMRSLARLRLGQLRASKRFKELPRI